MTLNLYDLTNTQRSLVYAMFDAAKTRFPEIATDFEIWLNPDNKENILVNVNVPFYDNDREVAFWDYVAELSCENHEQSGVHISLLPCYVPEMATSPSHEPSLAALA